MSGLVWLALATGCRKAPDVPPPSRPEPEAPAPAEGDPFDALVRALSMRDAAPPCETLEALSPRPVADLLKVVETVRMPPTAGMLAAACLLDRHPQEVVDTVETWMVGADTRGLCLLVTQRLDTLPMGTAVRLVGVGLQGPHAADVRAAVEASARPELRALLGAAGQ